MWRDYNRFAGLFINLRFVGKELSQSSLTVRALYRPPKDRQWDMVLNDLAVWLSSFNRFCKETYILIRLSHSMSFWVPAKNLHPLSFWTKRNEESLCWRKDPSRLHFVTPGWHKGCIPLRWHKRVHSVHDGTILCHSERQRIWQTVIQARRRILCVTWKIFDPLNDPQDDIKETRCLRQSYVMEDTYVRINTSDI